jgi:hypothetical protein
MTEPGARAIDEGSSGRSFDHGSVADGDVRTVRSIVDTAPASMGGVPAGGRTVMRADGVTSWSRGAVVGISRAGSGLSERSGASPLESSR